jgi:dihydropyrimidinase
VIAPGYDADLCVFDPDAAWTVSTCTLHENCDWTPYDGLELTGRAQHTVSRGRVVVEDGVFVGERGSGEYVKRTLAR